MGVYTEILNGCYGNATAFKGGKYSEQGRVRNSLVTTVTGNFFKPGYGFIRIPNWFL
jgi:hypothetical protein